jgi:beta-phosphoglucomutase family hydrolase
VLLAFKDSCGRITHYKPAEELWSNRCLESTYKDNLSLIYGIIHSMEHTDLRNRTPESSLAVIWDMDGVLVDTGEFHFQVWQEILGRYDVPFDRERFRQTFGMNNLEFLQLILGERFNPQVAAEISISKEAQLRRKIRGRLQPFSGVMSLLKELHTMQIPQALASSAPLANIKAILVEIALEKFFQETVSAEHMPGKPDPAVFLEASRRLNVPPERCLVIEDALPGVQAALNAGMRCLAVATTNPSEALSAADLVVESLEQIDITDLINLLDGNLPSRTPL